MAIGKNKKLGKGRKGGKKKVVDPFTRKEWYDIKVPAIFQNRLCGKTPVTKTIGTKIASEQLKGRVFEISLGDLNKQAEDAEFRKIRLVCEEVQGSAVLCNFYGMTFTRDKLCSLVRKFQTLIEANVDVKTTDGFTVRVFVIGFTKKQQNQIKRTAYAQSAQVRKIRQTMIDVLNKEVSKGDMKELFQKLVAGSIADEITKSVESTFPMQNVFLRKVKIVKAPKFDLTRLMEVHGDGAADSGKAISKVDEGTVEAMGTAGGRL